MGVVSRARKWVVAWTALKRKVWYNRFISEEKLRKRLFLSFSSEVSLHRHVRYTRFLGLLGVFSRPPVTPDVLPIARSGIAKVCTIAITWTKVVVMLAAWAA